jgi:rRNA maturation protein Rpf1
MKIVSKEIKIDGSQSIVYLVDENGNPLKANIVSQDEKSDLINDLLSEYFTPKDWVNNKKNLLNEVEEITYKEYINQ